MLGLQRLLYGRLNAVEIEQLYEKGWVAITETCLAMTVFRGEFGGWFLVMFVALLIGKVWGWIGEGRFEILEQQPPRNPRVFHARLSSSLMLSMVFDYLLLDYSVRTVLRQARPDMMVMFGFEFAVLSLLSTSTAVRYSIHLVELLKIKQQKQVLLAERKAELEAERKRLIDEQPAAERGTEPERAAEIKEEITNLSDTEIEVPGWETKGKWVFCLDLATGKKTDLLAQYVANSIRFPQACALPLLFCDADDFLWPSDPHSQRCHPYNSILSQATVGLLQIYKSNERHEHKISRRYDGRPHQG